MATQIVFISRADDRSPLAIHVKKNPEDVFAEWTRAGAQPFALERTSGDLVYVNPSVIAFWEEQREEPTEPGTEA